MEEPLCAITQSASVANRFSHLHPRRQLPGGGAHFDGGGLGGHQAPQNAAPGGGGHGQARPQERRAETAHPGSCAAGALARLLLGPSVLMLLRCYYVVITFITSFHYFFDAGNLVLILLRNRIDTSLITVNHFYGGVMFKKPRRLWNWRPSVTTLASSAHCCDAVVYRLNES